MRQAPPRKLAAVTALAIVVLGLAAPAAALSHPDEPEATQVVSMQLEAASLRGRVGERAHDRIVLSPGQCWVPLYETAARVQSWGLVAPRRVLANEHTELGWCHAHSSSTAIP